MLDRSTVVADAGQRWFVEALPRDRSGGESARSHRPGNARWSDTAETVSVGAGGESVRLGGEAVRWTVRLGCHSEEEATGLAAGLTSDNLPPNLTHVVGILPKVAHWSASWLASIRCLPLVDNLTAAIRPSPSTDKWPDRSKSRIALRTSCRS
jgi:hypothetical protein